MALHVGIVLRFCAGGAVGSKSYLMVVETHDAAMIWTLTSPVAANQLAACVFFVENGHQDLDKPDFG